jgi:hypothetical protein
MHRILNLNRRPGSILGPCLGPCLHAVCHAAKRISRSTCPICDRRIGYGRLFTDSPVSRDGVRMYVHAGCLIAHMRERGPHTAEQLIGCLRRLADSIGPKGAGLELSAAADEAEARLMME